MVCTEQAQGWTDGGAEWTGPRKAVRVRQALTEGTEEAQRGICLAAGGSTPFRMDNQVASRKLLKPDVSSAGLSLLHSTRP